MGTTNWIRSLPIIVSVFFSHSANAFLTLNATTEIDTEALSTKKVWKLDRYEKNPHRKRWVLERNLDLLGLKYENYQVRAEQLVSKTVIHVRQEEKWYRNIEDFPCTYKPVSWFATRARTLKIAKKAAMLWEKRVKINQSALEVILKQTSDSNKKDAIERVQKKIKQWFVRMDQKWREDFPQLLREQEWDDYIAEARRKKICRGFHSRRKEDLEFDWKKLISTPKHKKTELLARAPAKRWEGAYSIKTSLKVGKYELSGRFLIDPSVEESLIDPAFLVRQGVPLGQLTNHLIPNKKIRWGDRFFFGKWFSAEQFKIAGVSMDQGVFWMMDTKIYRGPNHLGVCCDGVLGLNFLRKYAFKFLPDQAPAVEIFDRKDFAMTFGTPWFEVATDREGKIMSSCRITSGSLKDHPIGIRWNMKQSEGLVLGVKRRNRRKLGTSHELTCQHQKIAPKIADRGHIKRRFDYDIAYVGSDLLDRGQYVLDLGNGRIWFSAAGLTRSPLRNRVGLKLGFKNGILGRELRVLKIAKGSPADQLKKLGLIENTLIQEVNERPSTGFDLWQIQRLFSGKYKNKKVKFRFRGKKGWQVSEVSLEQ